MTTTNSSRTEDSFVSITVLLQTKQNSFRCDEIAQHARVVSSNSSSNSSSSSSKRLHHATCLDFATLHSSIVISPLRELHKVVPCADKHSAGCSNRSKIIIWISSPTTVVLSFILVALFVSLRKIKSVMHQYA